MELRLPLEMSLGREAACRAVFGPQHVGSSRTRDQTQLIHQGSPQEMSLKSEKNTLSIKWQNCGDGHTEKNIGLEHKLRSDSPSIKVEIYHLPVI